MVGARRMRVETRVVDQIDVRRVGHGQGFRGRRRLLPHAPDQCSLGPPMRIKIIAVNALIVAVIGVLSFLLVRSGLSAATGDYNQLSVDAKRDVQGAAA